jgi:two-component sensor histidine kinase
VTLTGLADTRLGEQQASPWVAAPTQRLVLACIGAYTAAAVLLIPFASAPGPEVPGLGAFFAAGVFATELSTAFLLFVRLRDTRTWSLLVLACAYLFSSVMTIPYVLTFPGALLVGRGVIDISRQSTAWIFIPWIAGYSCLTLIATVLEGWSRDNVIRADWIDAATGIAVAVTLGAVGAAVLAATVFVDSMPVLIGGPHTGWTDLDGIISYTSLSFLCIGVLIILFKVRRSSEVFLWLGLALTAMAFGNILSTNGGGRFTVGWSVSRLSWVASGCVLFLYFIGQFVRNQRLLRHANEELEHRVGERTADLTEMVSQRDLLLREVHHRVRNNVQVVSSLIHFQASHAQSPETQEVLRRLYQRVFALGIVHQHMMRSGSLADFDIERFLKELCVELANGSNARQRGIWIMVEAEALQIDLDLAGAIAMLVAELVMNALQRDFSGGDGASVTVALHRDGPDHLLLGVSSTAADGASPLLVGEAPEDRIVQALIRQVNGALIESAPDGIAAIRLPFRDAPA